MKSKYSGTEIENKLDLVSHKVNKYDIIDSCPITLDPKFNTENIFNSNVIIKLLQQIKLFKLQSPNAFLEFVDRIPGYHLLTDEQADKLLHLSANFVGVFLSINDVPNIFKNGSVALVQKGPFGHPELIFRSRKKWYYLNGSKINYESTKGDKLIVGHNVIQPYNMAKVTLYANNNIGTETIEFNVIKSKKNWWIQVFKSTLLETDNNLVELTISRTPNVDPYPEINIEALQNCNISVNLQVIL